MGKNIVKKNFTEDDFKLFRERLVRETKILEKMFKSKSFKSGQKRGGFELEAWIINNDLSPVALNDQLLQKVGSPLVVPELSQYNFEINSRPKQLSGDFLSECLNELVKTWGLCEREAQKLETNVLAIGILPTLKQNMLGLDQVTPANRYLALNNEIFKRRENRPVEVSIHGKDKLLTEHQSVMLEAATTSLQIHMEVSGEKAHRYYNASIIASAAMVALSANSPFVFGNELWDESRIPLFEQAVYLPSIIDPQGNALGRVNFGTGYAKKSLFEVFLENLNFDILLPSLYDSNPEDLEHLILQNSTIWRWNRPLVGMDKKGRPSLRIEHRVPAAGPCHLDNVANMAFFIGLTESLARRDFPLEKEIPFKVAKENFYTCARDGLNAQVKWFNGKTIPIQGLILDHFFPMAKQALERMQFSSRDIRFFMDEVLKPRIVKKISGASWQKEYFQKVKNSQEMLNKYLENQKKNIPIHEWKIAG